MRRRFRLLALLAVIGLLVFGAWIIFDWPPPRLLLEYGLPPAGGPTGRTRKIEDLGGLEFIELSPGYFRMGSHYLCERGDVLGVVAAAPARGIAARRRGAGRSRAGGSPSWASGR